MFFLRNNKNANDGVPYANFCRNSKERRPRIKSATSVAKRKENDCLNALMAVDEKFLRYFKTRLLINALSRVYPYYCLRVWRNWQTRQVEGLMGVYPVEVRVLSPAGKETKIDGGNHDVTTKRSSM